MGQQVVERCTKKPIQYVSTDDFYALKLQNYLTFLLMVSVAGLIDTSSVDSAIFGTGKFYKENKMKKEDIYSNIDEMLNSTLSDEDKNKKSLKILVNRL